MSIFFDIGANIGNWSLKNISLCDKIITIEAVPETFKTLENNVKHNLNIIPLNYAVCESLTNEIIFYKAKSNTLSTINLDWLTKSTSRFCGEKYEKITCKTIKIDKLIELYGIPDLIKIDTEGGEFECIKSLTQKVNNLCFEWASETNDITFDCLDYLYNLGFRDYHLQNQDDYLFRPDKYYNINTIKNLLNNTIAKIDWGMIWCK
jgi:FkbM family methyltransferase